MWIFAVFLVLAKREKKRRNLQCFVPLAWNKFFLQNVNENCVNTSVFARPGPKKHCKHRVFCLRKQQHRKYCGFGLLRCHKHHKHQYLRCFFAPRGVARTMRTMRTMRTIRTIRTIIRTRTRTRTRTRYKQTLGPPVFVCTNNNNNNKKKRIKRTRTSARTTRRTRTRTRADLRSSGTPKLHASWILVHLHAHMSFAIAEKACLPRQTFPLTAMCLLQLSLRVTLSINILA